MRTEQNYETCVFDKKTRSTDTNYLLWCKMSIEIVSVKQRKWHTNWIVLLWTNDNRTNTCEYTSYVPSRSRITLGWDLEHAMSYELCRFWHDECFNNKKIIVVYRLLAALSWVCGINEKNSRLQPEMIWNEIHSAILCYVGSDALWRIISVYIN